MPTLVNIANALGVTVDDILCDSVKSARASFEREMSEILADCSHRELKILTGNMRALKENLRNAEETDSLIDPETRKAPALTSSRWAPGLFVISVYAFRFLSMQNQQLRLSRLSLLAADQGSWDTTHPWVGQAEHLACRKRQLGAFAGAARTHSGREGHHGKAPVAAVSALCAGFGERLEEGFLSRVFGQRGRLGRRLWAINSEKEHLQGARFWALWGRSIFVLG